jgi:hypothetical protein
MTTYIIVSISSGILFGVLDGVIHTNPFARKLYGVYGEISRTNVNVVAGIVIDLVYGFVLAGVFLLLYQSLPGQSGFLKGLSYGVLLWFLRVVMNTASQWIMFTVPRTTHLYTLLSGLAEMLILGILYGATLKPDL